MFAGRLFFLSTALCLLLAPKQAQAELSVSAEFTMVRASEGHSGFGAMFSLAVPFGGPGAATGVVAQPPTEPPRVVVRDRIALLDPRFVRRVLLAAHRAGGRPQAQARLESLAARSRTSAALPELSLRAERSIDESLRLAPTINDPYRYTQAGGVRTVVGGKLTWRLNRLVFAADELAVERLRLQRAESDAKRAALVLRTLFDWQRALSRARSDEIGAEEQAEAALAALEAELVLDAITNGWFSRALAKRAR
jgi:hypothetical protein